MLALSACIPAVAASTFQEKVTYIPSLTSAERSKIHGYVEALSGDVGDAVAGDGSYNPLTLVGAMLDGGSYDSISVAPVARPYRQPIRFRRTTTRTIKASAIGSPPSWLGWWGSQKLTDSPWSYRGSPTNTFTSKLATPTRRRWSWRSATSTLQQLPSAPRSSTAGGRRQLSWPVDDNYLGR